MFTIINDPDCIGFVCGFSWLRLRCQWISGYNNPLMNGPQIAIKVGYLIHHFGR